MSAATPPPAKPAEREPRPRRNFRAVPVVLAVVLLAINVGLTGRIAWRLERQPAPASPPTLAEIVEGLARTAKAQEKAGKKEPASPTRAAFSFDSVAVLPFAGPPGASNKSEQAEAENAGPALCALLARDKRLRVVPFDKARQRKEIAPSQAAKALGAKAALTGAVKLDTFDNVLVEMQLIDAETGLTIWGKTTPLGKDTGVPDWKQKLTEALLVAAEQVRAHAAERAP
jgi:TolB-like protein